MTDLAIPTASHAEVAPLDPTGGRLIAWAEGLSAAHQIGSALCQTTFVPAQFRGKPEEAAAAILYGDEIGLTPTQALQSVYVVSGKPGLYARSMVALLLSQGHEIWTVEKTDAKVTVAGRRKGSAHTHQETWTTSRAQKAGYTNNKKYTTDPQAMLYARAAADVCRQVAPDALAGLAYSVEEMELSEVAPTTTVVRQVDAEQPRKVQRKKATPAPAAEPEFDTPTPAAEPGPELRTDAQSKKLWVLLRERFAGETEARAWLSSELGRELASTKEITKAECVRLIDHLEQPEPTPDADGVIDADVVGPELWQEATA